MVKHVEVYHTLLLHPFIPNTHIIIIIITELHTLSYIILSIYITYKT